MRRDHRNPPAGARSPHLAAHGDGGFRDVEEALFHALRTAVPQIVVTQNAKRTGSDAIAAAQTKPDSNLTRDPTLEEVFAKVRGLADDLDISRNPSTARPVDLS
jgi:hypothetical protein